MKAAVALSLALISPLAQGEPLPLERLTVPGDRLPADCRLATPPQPGAVVTGNAVVFPGALPGRSLSQNPWSSSDPTTLVALWEAMDRAPSTPDAVPIDPRQAARYRLRQVEGVERGYRATYDDSAGRVIVYALQVNDATRPHTTTLTNGTRVDLGNVVALIQGPSGSCTSAVHAYLTSLAR
jgi:hypothetical protein